jgi:hypothetical protein
MSWRRSSVLWFGLPFLIFLLIGWIDSMSRDSRLDCRVAGRSIMFQNHASQISISFYERSPGVSRAPDWSVRPTRQKIAGREWFPLPSYLSNDAFSSYRWHDLNFSYWFILLVALGLWQLPWLWRYHRREHIRRAMPEI